MKKTLLIIACCVGFVGLAQASNYREYEKCPTIGNNNEQNCQNQQMSSYMADKKAKEEKRKQRGSKYFDENGNSTVQMEEADNPCKGDSDVQKCQAESLNEDIAQRDKNKEENDRKANKSHKVDMQGNLVGSIPSKVEKCNSGSESEKTRCRQEHIKNRSSDVFGLGLNIF